MENMADNMANTTADDDDKAPASLRLSNTSQLSRRPDEIVLPGVAWMEASAEHITNADRLFILFGVLCIAWATGMDNMLRSVYHNKAMNELNSQALVATVYVAKSVISAATQPTAAKVSDVFGRVEMLLASVFLYVLGSAIEASAHSAATFVVGSSIHQLGWVINILILEVIIADTTSLRSRLLFSYIPIAPSLCNFWISGEVLTQMLRIPSWRFGFWLWCIVCPIAALPLVFSLLWVQLKAKRAGTFDGYRTPVQAHGVWEVTKSLFWQLDIIGMMLAVCAFGFILVPLTMNNNFFPNWKDPKIIAPLAIGVLCIPLWIKWEGIAPHPMVPFYLLKSRAVWGSFAIAFWMMFAWACQGDFMLTVLVVVFNQSPKAAMRIGNIYSFGSTLTGLLVGAIVYRVRRLKPFVLTGTFLLLVAFGIMIYYNTGDTSGFIVAQVILGIAGGFVPYAAQVSIQAATGHEHVAVVTGLYLSMYNVGFGFGNAVSGIIYSQVLRKQLKIRMSSDVAVQWYGAPITLASSYLPGSPVREAANQAFAYYQRVVCITGACGCLGLIVFSFCMRNPKLPETQSVSLDDLLADGRYDPEQSSTEYLRQDYSSTDAIISR